MKLTLKAVLSLPDGKYMISSPSTVSNVIELITSPHRYVRWNAQNNSFSPESYIQQQEQYMSTLNRALARIQRAEEYLTIQPIS